MRRKDKKVREIAEIEAILQKAEVCRLGLSLDNIPYIVPLNFGYKNNCLYFHSATEGKKIEILKQNNNVCFEVDVDTNLIKKPENPCTSSMKYKSVIGFGKISFLNSQQEKIEAFNIIISHYLPGTKVEFNEHLFKRVALIKVEISSMTGKKSND